MNNISIQPIKNTKNTHFSIIIKLFTHKYTVNNVLRRKIIH